MRPVNGTTIVVNGGRGAVAEVEFHSPSLKYFLREVGNRPLRSEGALPLVLESFRNVRSFPTNFPRVRTDTRELDGRCSELPKPSLTLKTRNLPLSGFN